MANKPFKCSACNFAAQPVEEEGGVQRVVCPQCGVSADLEVA